jgi:hypothetical protein
LSICREWSIVKQSPDERRAKILYCRSWSCEHCAPMRRRKLMAQAAAGEPTRFLTLTVNPAIGESQEQRLRLLAHAWRVLVKRIRRRWTKGDLAYLAVVEETERGEPHLHILLRGPYLPKAFLSAAMDELIRAPIVDIRRIRSRQEVVRYVAKYITKAPAQFGNAKRYWFSQNWEERTDTQTEEDSSAFGNWQVVMEPMVRVLENWTLDGFAVRKEGDNLYVGLHVGLEAALLYRKAFDHGVLSNPD